MRRRLAALLLALLPLTALADEGWKAYQDKDGVTSYSREIPGSKVLAMRGVAVVPVHVSRLMGVYLDPKRATSWVDLLVQLDEHPLPGGDDAVERQVYDMPWPVTDREFVFRRTVTWDEARRTVTIAYRSIDDARHPTVDDYVRGTDHGSSWRFTALPDGRTEVEAVAMVDPEGSLPKWLFNSVQRSWPRQSIQGLMREASKPDVKPLSRCAGW